ncbi:MAG: Get4 family protein, partial [Paramuribaculum sp.]|nr:Get4 family protein [Paramuribaculum sp.]
MKRIYIAILLAAVATIGLKAQTLAEAESLFAQGEYAEALPTLLEEAKAKPRNTALQHKAGMALLRTGRPAEARRYLAKGTNDSRIGLAEIAFLEYDFDGADEHLDEYESGLKRGRRKAAEPSPEAEILRERIEPVSYTH